MRRVLRRRERVFVAALLAALAACGGGGDSGVDDLVLGTSPPRDSESTVPATPPPSAPSGTAATTVIVPVAVSTDSKVIPFGSRTALTTGSWSPFAATVGVATAGDATVAARWTTSTPVFGRKSGSDNSPTRSSTAAAAVTRTSFGLCRKAPRAAAGAGSTGCGIAWDTGAGAGAAAARPAHLGRASAQRARDGARGAPHARAVWPARGHAVCVHEPGVDLTQVTVYLTVTLLARLRGMSGS